MQLIECQSRVESSERWTALSVSFHGVLIAAAIIATTGPVPSSDAERPARTGIVYVTPPTARPATGAAAPSGPGRVPTPEVRLPAVVLPDLAGRVGAQVSASLAALTRHAIGGSVPGPGSRDTASMGGVFLSHTVDRVVRPLVTNGQPDYPVALRSAGVGGAVVARFVVAATGTVEEATITIVSATHPQLAEAVRRWLPRTRYEPGELRGVPVRQQVEQRIDFSPALR